MEMKKLHIGTMSYGADSMDEVAHQLAVAFGVNADHGMVRPLCAENSLNDVNSAFAAWFDFWNAFCRPRTSRYIFQG